jgi:MFS family permease
MMTPRERARYQVYFASMFMTASLLGPVLGGFFAEHFHWSLIFWINLPLGVLALAISAKALRRLPASSAPIGRISWGPSFSLPRPWHRCSS